MRKANPLTQRAETQEKEPCPSARLDWMTGRIMMPAERSIRLATQPPLIYFTHTHNEPRTEEKIMGFELEGFDELSNKLNDMAKKAEELDGENEVPVNELCNLSFMKKHTSYASFDRLLEDGGGMRSRAQKILRPSQKTSSIDIFRKTLRSTAGKTC